MYLITITHYFVNQNTKDAKKLFNSRLFSHGYIFSPTLQN